MVWVWLLVWGRHALNFGILCKIVDGFGFRV